MVLTYAKLALLTGFVIVADAKKGKYGYRKNSDSGDAIVDEQDGEFVADSWGAQEDSKRPGIGMEDDSAKRLKKGGKQGKKKKGSEKDFTKGVLDTLADALENGDEENQMVPLQDVLDMFDSIVGEGYDPDNKAFEKGAKFADKKLYDEPGCRAECKDAPFAEGCQECCITYAHSIDWHCDSEDPLNPPAKCCTEWSEDCYTTDSDKNNNHACKDCGRGYGGYGYSRGYGRYGRGYGRRRASQSYGRRRASQSYGRRRASQSYGRRRAKGYGRRRATASYGRRRAGQGYGRSG